MAGTETTTTGGYGAPLPGANAPISSISLVEVLEAIRRAQAGGGLNEPNYKQFVDNFLTPNRNFDLSFGEGKRQYDTTRGDKQALLNTLGFGASGGGILGSLLGGSGGDAASNALLAQQRADTSRLLGDIGNYGAGQTNRINTQFQAEENSALGNLESRGLGASNLQSATRSAFASDKNQALLDLNDQLLGKKLDLETGLLGGQYQTQSDQLNRNLQKQLEGISLVGSIAGTYK